MQQRTGTGDRQQTETEDGGGGMECCNHRPALSMTNESELITNESELSWLRFAMFVLCRPFSDER